MENKMPGNWENDLDVYWNSIRKRNSDDSFAAIADWIREMDKSHRRPQLERRKRRRNSKWLVLLILPVLFILSCTIRVNSVAKSGSLVNFSIDKTEHASFQKLSSLQKLFTFSCYQFLQPDQPSIAFFIFFIPEKERVKLSLITRELKMLNGFRKLDISSINYDVRESLFSTFLHKTLKLGEQPRPKAEELTRNIQVTLKDRGLDFLSINVLNEKDGHIAFATKKQDLESLTIPNKDSSAVQREATRNNKVRNTLAGNDKLQIFNWLLGSWEVKYAPRTYHYWLRVNDSVLMCFIIKYADERLIKFGDEGPDISVGFSIRYSRSDSAILSLRGIEWKFVSANDKEVRFKNEVTPKSANVKWSLGIEKKMWQSVISGEGNLEIVTLARNESINLENTVHEFIEKHPDVIKKP